MTRDQIIELLQIVQAYDGRDVDKITAAAWAQAAQRQGWTFEESADAVHHHYSQETSWLMPGHVTRIIRRSRGANWQD